MLDGLLNDDFDKSKARKAFKAEQKALETQSVINLKASRALKIQRDTRNKVIVSAVLFSTFLILALRKRKVI